MQNHTQKLELSLSKETVSFGYPFGMLLPERTWTSDSVSYRYGFNTQERDDEIYGEGNSTTAEYWQYDSRLGRRWNVDPKYKIWESTYATFSCNPIRYNDIKGDTWDNPEKDQKEADKIKKHSSKRLKYWEKVASKYEQKVERLQKKLMKAEESGNERKANRIFNKTIKAIDDMGHAKKGVEAMSKTITTLDKMRDDPDKIFTLNRTSETNRGGFSMNERGVVVLNYSTNDLAVHEVTHADQYMRNMLGFICMNNTYIVYNYDVFDEVEAYTRQYFSNPFSVTPLSSEKIKQNTLITASFVLSISFFDSEGNSHRVYITESEAQNGHIFVNGQVVVFEEIVP